MLTDPSATSATRETFQRLLRELFQFDCADLDFGIYRVLNYKRDVIDDFLTKDLPAAVATELDRGVLADQSRAAENLRDIVEQIRKSLGPDAFDAGGDLADMYRDTPLGQKYINAKKAGGLRRDSLEAAIYNHLHTFFNRYYQDGDFISKRRYSRRQRYAIPYNGQEVFLHWANSDQYYVKSDEHFRDYIFARQNTTVHLVVHDAQVEQNDVKGDKRLFVPRFDDITFHAETARVLIPFDYRPLTAREEDLYGRRNQQEAIISAALTEVPSRLHTAGADAASALLTTERHRNGDGRPVNHLEYHLRRYTRRNTSDFFIHKNLKGFLARELDFYLKNEVLDLDELDAANEHRADGWFQIMRTIKAVGGQIIDFLDQIESFQKMLWEKRKFITETQYCITVGNIDPRLYPDIAACDPQWAEWDHLFHIDEQEPSLFKNAAEVDKRVALLEIYPGLVLDTKHFPFDFVDRLIGTVDDLDDVLDGLLVHGDNTQTLALLQTAYRGKIRCIHIDPPYNTQTSGFLYKNSYRHSSWLTMMENHSRLATMLLNDHGSIICHIDENEYERLHLLFEQLGIPNAGTVVWDKRNPMTGGAGIAIRHEYAIWRTKSDASFNLHTGHVQSLMARAKELASKYGASTKEARAHFAEWVRSNDSLSGGEKAYRYLDDDGRVYSSVSLRAPEPRTDPKFFEPLIHPVTGRPCPVPPNGFSRTPETLREMATRGEIQFGPDESTQPRQKRFLRDGSIRQLPSVIQEARRGKSELQSFGLDDFPYSHPVSLYALLIGAATAETNALVLDYFAGSGTTGHAVICLNQSDGARRKFILVEVGDHFDAILLPRVKKAAFTPKWKDGVPVRAATPREAGRGPRIIKYHRIESYEDALNNINFGDSDGQQALRFDDYVIKYLLKWETRRSETLLNVEKLTRPFDYRLGVHVDGSVREKIADLPETFNYLLGLQVRTRRAYYDAERRYLVYRGRLDQQSVAVIWRETEGWSKQDLIRDREFIAGRELTAEADAVFVNGDSFVPRARALEPVFKARMFAPLES